MEKFKDIFNNFVEKKSKQDVEIITDLCLELNIDPNEWFNNHFLKRDISYHSGTQFLSEMLMSFVFYLEKQFEICLHKYIEPDGTNIYDEPYISTDYELLYNYNDGFFIKHPKNFKKIIEALTLSQKVDLMENNLFSFIVNETNLKIYSKKEKRLLKLKFLDGLSKNNIT